MNNRTIPEAFEYYPYLFHFLPNHNKESNPCGFDVLHPYFFVLWNSMMPIINLMITTPTNVFQFRKHFQLFLTQLINLTIPSQNPDHMHPDFMIICRTHIGISGKTIQFFHSSSIFSRFYASFSQ